MPTTESIDLSARLEELADLLILQRAEPTLTAFDAVDLRSAAKELRRLWDAAEALEAENRRLRGVILDVAQRAEDGEYIADTGRAS